MTLEAGMHSLPPAARALVCGGYLALVGIFFPCPASCRRYSATSDNGRNLYRAGMILISAPACQSLEEPANRRIQEWLRADKIHPPLKLRYSNG